MPPPGFGPKIDKKKVAEEAAVIPPSERYSIRLERQEEEILRQVLTAAEQHTRHSTKLLRDQKKLHQMYSHLSRLGFSNDSIEECLPHVRVDHGLPDALDWCCLHLPEAVLPAAFKLSRIGEGETDDKDGAKGPAATRQQLAAPRVAAKVAEREAIKAAAAAKAKAAAAKAAAREAVESQAALNKRLAARMIEGGSSEEENELTDALGILELDEVR